MQLSETRRQHRRLTRTFGQYVPPQIVAELADRDIDELLDSERREMTVLFSDVRSFTDISEKLGPEDVADLLNRFLTEMTRIIFENNGTVDKYVGDMIMAFWNAPLGDTEHASNAVRTSLAMQAKVAELRAEFQSRFGIEFNVGVGINSGVMSVGNMGSAYRLAYTVVGDAVNVGSRLEGICKFYGVPIIVSEHTHDQAKGFAYRELDLVRVKGREAPLRIFQPIGEAEGGQPASGAEEEDYEKALSRYRSGDFPGALRSFTRLCEQQPDVALFQLYQRRLVELVAHPPEGEWDGVFEHESK